MNRRMLSVDIDGVAVDVPVRIHARARRMILRLDPRTQMPALTSPPRVSDRALRSFLDDSRAWIAAEWLARPPQHPLTDGQAVPFLGCDYRLMLDPAGPRAVRIDGACIVVGGPTDMVSRRLADFMQREARIRLTPQVHDAAARLGTRAKTVRFGDTSSRWGSCSARAAVRLNWRLVMAPDWVQGYVAAHEAAHLIEMNHSPRFWALVADLVADWKSARKWLRSEAGRRLMTFPVGAAAPTAPVSVTE